MVAPWLEPALSTAAAAALSEVVGWIEQFGFERLGPDDLKAYAPAEVGWRVQLEAEGQVFDTHLILPVSFPWSPPRVFLADPPPFPSWPHVEDKGALCVLPSNAEWDLGKPVALVQRVLQGSLEVLGAGVRGDNHAEFRDEVRSYWSVRPGEVEVRSLLSPEGPSRVISLWRGKDFTLAGDDRRAMDDWLDHWSPGSKSRRTYTTALLCWLAQAPIPSEYPDTVERLTAHLERSGLINELPGIISEGGSHITVVFGFPAAEGSAFLAVDVHPSRAGRRRGQRPVEERLAQGFRSKRVPPEIITARLLTNAQIVRRSVQRFDPAWVHGRDTNDDLKELRTSQVAFVGCGSLGSYVARLLAAAGVGAFVLIDPENLTSSNTGRHALGAASVGKPKSAQLAMRLEKDFPHLYDTEVVVGGWETAVQERGHLLDDADLIISTVGSWRKEQLLDGWLAARGNTPVIFGWAEPHAVAGQAVLIDHAEEDGRFCCGMGPEGEPLFKVSRWNAATIKQEPACGAFFQPYGAVHLDGVARMIAELALDALMDKASNRTHRIWTARREALERAGGAWSEDWLQITGGDAEGGREVERVWSRAEGCKCGTSQ